MAITIFHRIININKNKIRIINKKKEPKLLKVSADIKTTRHIISEDINYG